MKLTYIEKLAPVVLILASVLVFIWGIRTRSSEVSLEPGATITVSTDDEVPAGLKFSKAEWSKLSPEDKQRMTDLLSLGEPFQGESLTARSEHSPKAATASDVEQQNQSRATP